MTATSFLVPAAGVLTSPILSRALGADGRGDLAAAIAPVTLMLTVATFGLPDALTFFLAKHPQLIRPLTLRAGLATAGLGLVSFLILLAFLPLLSAGDLSLGRLMLLAALIGLPTLVQGVLRGAATGLQMWNRLAVEKFVSTGIRLIGLFGLWLSGYLTVFTAVLISMVGPLIAGMVYLPLIWRTPGRGGEQNREQELGRETLPNFRRVSRFGIEAWVGSVAIMALARSAALIMVPLSNSTQLGLFAVSTTISDVPLIVAMSVQGTLFGVSSKDVDPARVTTTSRLTLLVGLLGCAGMGLTLPLWIRPIFGPEFGAATLPTILNLISSLIAIPGLMAASGISASGRPGLRSFGVLLALGVDVLGLFLLVPSLGAVGAGWVAIITDTFMTTFMIIVSARSIGLPARDFVAIRFSDVKRVWAESSRVGRSVFQKVRGRPAESR